MSLEVNQIPKTYNWDIVWRNVLIMGLMHLSAIYGLYLYWSSALIPTLIFVKIYGMTSLLGQTAGAHRLRCHRSYKATNSAQIILMIMSSMTYQNSIYVWSKDHRLHHQKSETEADPHNANRGVFFSHVGWLLVRKQKEVIEAGKKIDFSDLEANAIVMFQHKYYYVIMLLFTFAIPIFIPWYFWNESFKTAFFAAGLYRYIVNLNMVWCLNSFAHMYGNKPYDKTIGPTENTILMYIGIGEGFHNYHHSFPWDYRASEFGTDSRNFTTCFIDTLAYYGMVTDRKFASEDIITKRVKRTGDGTHGDKHWLVPYLKQFDFNVKLALEFKNMFYNALFLIIL